VDKCAGRFENAQVKPGLENGPPHIHKNPYMHLRRNIETKQYDVTSEMIMWFQALPPSLRPKNLVSRFPRIGNALAQVANRPKVVQTLLQGYMLDDRGGRQGFPFEVLQEMASLLEYYERLNRKSQQDAWAVIREKSPVQKAGVKYR
jgi:hypothetical protein